MSKGEPHPLVPHLYRIPKSRSDASLIYPYLHSQVAAREGGKLKPPSSGYPMPKGNIADDKRGAVSPLGGVAKPASEKG